MSSITRPSVPLLELERNALGLTVRDYEGEPSTLCAGCGHDGLTAAIVQALWAASLRPNEVVKISGIGCSSKIPTYFARGAHGFNSVHGRAAPIATGANAANRRLHYVVVSGDGDSLSIGLGHLAHAIRRNVRLTYIVANNGVYGLTKGQLSASADVGSSSRHGEVNALAPIDPLALGLAMGATFLARGFSGDRQQLVALLEAAFEHRGFALLDVISPCVQFGNHDGSTKSYAFVRAHERLLGQPAGEQAAGPTAAGSPDRSDRLAVAALIEEHRRRGEIPMGVLLADESVPELHEREGTSPVALNALEQSSLCPGAAALEELQGAFR